MAHIQELRQSRGGKLSGLTMAGIIQHVAERLVKIKTPVRLRFRKTFYASAIFLVNSSFCHEPFPYKFVVELCYIGNH